MSEDTPAEPEKYQALRRRLRSRRRDDPALDLFRQAETSLADVDKVDRILRELGKCYNPLTNGPIVTLDTRKRIIEALRAGKTEDARRQLDERLNAYASWGEGNPER